MKLDCEHEPKFITKSLPKDQVYDMWLAQLNKLQQSTMSKDIDDTKAEENSLDLGFRLFPLIDSVSYNLFGKNGRCYLRKLGYSSLEADLIFKMFRNGQLHNTSTYRLRYEDGDISWGLMSSSGSSGFGPHFPGYESMNHPEDNMPADKAFELKEINGELHAILQLDRLASQIRCDLEQRKRNDKSGSLEFIIGQNMQGSRPIASHTRHTRT